MPNYNKVQIMGNITRDIELKYTPKGTAVAELGLAINRKFNDVEETTFIDVTLWGKVAEIAAKYSSKGQPLFVEGRLQMDSWDDKSTGQKRTKLKVVGENIQLLGSGGNQNTKTQQPAPTPQTQPAAANDSDDIPF